jgi:hypothetical protein
LIGAKQGLGAIVVKFRLNPQGINSKGIQH